MSPQRIHEALLDSVPRILLAFIIAAWRTDGDEQIRTYVFKNKGWKLALMSEWYRFASDMITAKGYSISSGGNGKVML